MDIHNELGPGWDEWDYHRAMIKSLESRDHTVISHDRRSLIYNEQDLHSCELDLLVDDLIILDLKHLKSGFHPSHSTQLLNYLKLWHKRLGILLNFGQDKLRYERLPYDEKITIEIVTDDAWGSLGGPCGHVHRGVQKILAQIGYGYSADIFKKLLMCDLELDGINVSVPIVAPDYHGERYEKRELDAFSVDQSLLVNISASSSATDLRRLLAHMKHSGIEEGVLVDLSDSRVFLRGLVL